MVFSINSHAGGEVKWAGTKENIGKNEKKEEGKKRKSMHY